ncbi:MAG: hypothetical protein P8O16_06935 [Algoriphagus sp.]|uniref:hypothetical protein n=1 Tax=Algoriphagus sp. TaxID=1872435 RepID=UPI00262600D2|nr:hypothetical protein [Algoriphagus sp.]MDG1276999.1 hypothetical protein [Algoriphagus sp.]
MNLNELKIPAHGESLNLQNFSKRVKKPQFDEVEVLFRGLEPRLIELINDYRGGVVFGCVAWLTSEPILLALAECLAVQIIVQKEDFLRPDMNKLPGNFIDRLQKLYSNLKFIHDRYQCASTIGQLSICGDPTVDPIRCLGNHNSAKQAAFPRAHNKFLVFCRASYDEEGVMIRYKPTAVWTGSFNLTYNATNSFENAVVMHDQSGKNEILWSFLQEHHQLFALSEKLNWTLPWVDPQYKFGE